MLAAENNSVLAFDTLIKLGGDPTGEIPQVWIAEKLRMLSPLTRLLLISN